MSLKAFATRLSLCAAVLTMATSFLSADEPVAKGKRVGIIGLDTSHSTAFAGELNKKDPNPAMRGFRVTAAYPYGSKTIESSSSRIPKITEDIQKLGVKIVPSIAALLEEVDFVLLETNDGHPHLEQALEVMAARKPLFIDKPVAGSLADSVAIYEAARHYGVPVFSSSSLRYADGSVKARSGSMGPILGATAISPCSLEPSHPDFYWYGIHGVETLFTAMGPGCLSVSRTSTPGVDLAVGVWDNNRIGTFRGIREGRSGYALTVYTAKEMTALPMPVSYNPLLVEIAKFFETGKSPVSEQETLEIYAFMSAADESKKLNGAHVTLESVLTKAKAEAATKLAGKLK